jgi:hypothetical protein
MPRAGFEPATPATKRPQTYDLDRAATGIDSSRTLASSKRLGKLMWSEIVSELKMYQKTDIYRSLTLTMEAIRSSEM